ncbi:hypothetical protein AVEN_53158-1 [Araneus ventricosus]|uniref:Uncharacterized protein n=1 Tax=Araneus ventricosus TaxID=182803 RepID=A0A4Y2A9Z1_ARAVE|nr:hypothetical protein AVEN_53158-1 [Araneus ventricosus]
MNKIPNRRAIIKIVRNTLFIIIIFDQHITRSFSTINSTMATLQWLPPDTAVRRDNTYPVANFNGRGDKLYGGDGSFPRNGLFVLDESNLRF